VFIVYCFSRSDAVRQTLCRHVTLKNSVETEKEHFVVDKLHVSVEWVHEAKVKLHSDILFSVFYLIRRELEMQNITYETAFVNGFDLSVKIRDMILTIFVIIFHDFNVICVLFCKFLSLLLHV